MGITPFLFKLFWRPSEALVLRDFNRTYHHHLIFSSAHCRISPPRPPNPSVLLVVGLLFCILYGTVFLETFARRLCRGIAASFFPACEEERVLHLYRRLARRHRREQNPLKGALGSQGDGWMADITAQASATGSPI